MIKRILLLLFFPALAFGQGIPLKSGASSDLATVNTSKALLTQVGLSTKATYGASAGALSCNATNLLVIESAAGTGFKLASWCVSYSSVATAAAAINVFVRRETTASSSGTLLTAEGTGTTSISQFVPGTGNFGGVARGGAATSGTAGATLDQVGFSIGEVGAGAADPPSPGIFCRTYGLTGDQLPTVSAGIANGLVISMSASGAGGLSNCALSAVIISE